MNECVLKKVKLYDYVISLINSEWYVTTTLVEKDVILLFMQTRISFAFLVKVTRFAMFI